MHEIVSFSKEIEFKNMINKITSISLEHTLMLENGFNIRGDFIVSGTYKMTAATRLENDFSYKIPVDIEVDDKYDLSNLIIDIDNFTYEGLDEEVLKVNIDLLLDKLELKKEEQVRKIETLEEEVVNAEDLFLEIDDKKDLTILNDDDIEILDVEQVKKENMRDEDNYDDEVEDTFKKIEEQKEAEEINLNNINVEEQTSESNKKSLETENSPSLFATFDTSQETYSTYTVYIVRENDSLDEIMNKYKISKEKLEEYNNLNEIKIGTKLIIPNIKDE